MNIKDPGSTSLVGRLDVQVITNSQKRSVFTDGLDFMDLIIMRLKLCYMKINNRKIFLLEDKNQVLYLSHIPSKLLAEWEAVSQQKDGSLHGTHIVLVT